jgi:hypothetical protein
MKKEIYNYYTEQDYSDIATKDLLLYGFGQTLRKKYSQVKDWLKTNVNTQERHAWETKIEESNDNTKLTHLFTSKLKVETEFSKKEGLIVNVYKGNTLIKSFDLNSNYTLKEYTDFLLTMSLYSDTL